MSDAVLGGLIFDLDGLLVDSEPFWFEAEAAFLRSLGHDWTQQGAEACMGQGTPNTLRYWRDVYGVEVDIERDTERIIDVMIERAFEMRMMKGAMALIERAQARDIPMAVASSSPRRLIEAVLEAKGIRKYFRVVVSGQEVPKAKPAPDVFLRAGEGLGIALQDCVVLEDTLAGTRAGVASGARVLAVPTTPSSEFFELATWVLNDLEEAIDVLLG
jgi:HAD superfamily hydrolase (TIGR01509 family)